ncbi:MAG: lamin tail domain-containing protein, partial [Candidatus Limiplasma sp.]|nr:lamin tail domain-containing protein [Candidatus Limiplasma sp.]
MQHNTPQQHRPTKDYTPRKRKTRAASVLPLLVLFVVLLGIMYFVLPKESGKHIGRTQYDGLVISEVMAANSSAVPDETGSFSDWLEIYNGTGADLNMEGVMLTNRTDRITFPFPSYMLKAGERVIVFADNRYQLDPTLPFHGKFKISSVGTHIYMYDPEMYLIDEVVTPTMTADQSFALMGTDENGQKKYELTDYYSPGFENSEDGFVAYRAQNATRSGALIINEVCPDPKVGIPDEDNEIVDWIELRNTTNETISLSGYYLSDKENRPLKWRFPESATIAP